MMNTLITRIFLATAPGKQNKTEVQQSTVAAEPPKSRLEPCQRTPAEASTLKEDSRLLDYLLLMLPGEEATEEITEEGNTVVAEELESARRMHYSDFAGCVVDLDCTHNNTLPASGRWLCIQQIGNRLTLLPLAITGDKMLYPTYVSFGGSDAKVVAVEIGDEEWEHAYDSLTDFGSKLCEYYHKGGKVPDNEMPSIYYYHMTPEQGLARAEGEGLIAKRIYQMLVDCE